MKAKRLILAVVAALAVGVGNGSGATNEVSGLLQKGLFEEEANHNLDAAVQAYQAVVAQTDKDHKFAATAIFRLGECYRKLGKTNEANAQYQRVLREFPDQTELATLSRQQLGSAAGQLESPQVGADEIKAIKMLSPEKRRVAVQQMFPNPVLNTLMQKMTETEQQLTAFKHDLGPQHPDVERTTAVLKNIYQQIDDQVDAVLAGRTTGAVSAKQDVAAPDGAPDDGEAEQVKKLQAMLRDSPDLLNIHIDTSGGSRLHEAAQYGRLRVARFLLDNHADVNARNRDQYTPLHLAAGSGRKDMAELLLSHGAKADVQAKDGSSPLHFAAERGYKAIAELLLTHGAAVDARLNDGETPLHKAAHSGNVAVGELLLANKADVNAKDVNGGTPLYMAAEMGQTAMAELLIANHAELNPQRQGLTPLMKAIAQNNTDTAKLILQHGADIKIQTPDTGSDWPGWAALEFAVDKNNAEIVKLLLDKGADVNLKVQQGLTPLIAAVNNKHLAITKLLVEHGADVNSRMDEAHPNTPRWTALAAAVSVSGNELVSLLLEHHADPNLNFDLRNNNEFEITPLMMAAWNKENDNVKILLEYKANPDLKDRRGYTALFRAFAFGNRDLASATVLVENKANMEIKYDEGKTLLFFATEANAEDFVKLLLAHGAQPNAPNDYGKTALHAAAANNAKTLVELLLAHGADVNAKDKQGDTPLDVIGKAGAAGNRPMRPGGFTVGTSGGGNTPLAYQWQLNVDSGTNEEGGDVGMLLRQHGGVAEVDVATIRMMRNGKVAPTIIFRKDAAGYNHYTLYEIILQAYGPLTVANSQWRQWGGDALKFPDFSKVKIYHLRESGRTNFEIVDMEKALGQGGCSQNIFLKWGDVVDVPETDHKVSESYSDLPQATRNALGKCMLREVSIKVKGQTTRVRLMPDQTDLAAAPAEGVIPLRLHVFWLRDVLNYANVILASSDLTRIKVTRGGKDMVMNLENENSFWLEDGDVIEIPEKGAQ